MRPRPANREPQSAHNDLVKTEFTEVSETRKHLTFEIPSDVVDAEIDRVAKGYSRTARVPGFRPGKVPATVVRQRYKDQILYDVAHDLIPRLVGDALRERGLEPVATPDINDVSIEEGQPLKFVADFETLPPIDPGEYTGVTLRKQPAVLEVGAVDQAIERLRQQAARWHPVEDRPAATGDTLLVDLTRTRRRRLVALPGEAEPPPAHADDDKPETLQNVSIELGNENNPPGFDDHLIGTGPDDHRTFTSTHADQLRGRRAGGRDGGLRRHGEGRASQGAARARRRVREGSERVRLARRAARPRAARPAARSRARVRPQAAARPAPDAGRAACARRRTCWSIARSIGGSRSSCAG